MEKLGPSRRFLVWFFVAGACAPTAFMLLGWIASTYFENALSDSVRSWEGTVLWILWPTWLLMFDAEHLGTIIPALLLSAPINGLWYIFLGCVFWYSCEAVKRIWKAISNS